MLPKWHFLLGIPFVLILFSVFNFSLTNIIIIFLINFFIDVDHYIWYVGTKKDIGLRNAFNYLIKYGPEQKIMVIFHTIEFLIILTILTFYFNFLFPVFLAIIFHNLTDTIYLIIFRETKLREFSFFKHLVRKKSIFNSQAF